MSTYTDQSTLRCADSGEASTRHPPAFLFFFWGEFAERCSYYGMRTILPLYLTIVLALPDTTAGPVYSWFKMACYFLPLVGGYLADRWFRGYWTIVGFAAVAFYFVGHRLERHGNSAYSEAVGV